MIGVEGAFADCGRRGEHSSLARAGVSPGGSRSHTVRQRWKGVGTREDTKVRRDSVRCGYAKQERAHSAGRIETPGGDCASGDDVRASRYRNGGSGHATRSAGFSGETNLYRKTFANR